MFICQTRMELGFVSKSNRDKYYKSRPLKNPTFGEEMKSIRHRVRRIIRESNFEELDLLSEKDGVEKEKC